MILKASNINKKYGDLHALNNFNIEIESGEVVGFVGANGAGKSTTLDILSGLIKKYEGEFDISSFSYIPSEPTLPDKQLEELVELYEGIHNVKKGKSIDKFIEILSPSRAKFSKLSLGNKKKVAFIISLLKNPDLIMMDEATSGLDPVVKDAVWQFLSAFVRNGKSIFFSTHTLEEVEKYCSRVVLIKNGKVLFDKAIEEIQASLGYIYEVPKIYENLMNKNDLEIIATENDLLKIKVPDQKSMTKLIYEEQIDNYFVRKTKLEEAFNEYYQ